MCPDIITYYLVKYIFDNKFISEYMLYLNWDMS